MSFMTASTVQNLPEYQRQINARRRQKTIEQEKQEQKERQKLASEVGFDIFSGINGLSPEEKQNPQAVNKLMTELVSKYKSNPLYDKSILQEGFSLAQRVTQQSREYQTYQQQQQQYKTAQDEAAIEKKDVGILAQLMNPNIQDKAGLTDSLSPKAQVGYYGNQAKQRLEADKWNVDKKLKLAQAQKALRDGSESGGPKYPIALYKDGQERKVYSRAEHDQALQDGFSTTRLTSEGISARKAQQEAIAESFSMAGGEYHADPTKVGGEFNMRLEDAEPKDVEEKIKALNASLKPYGLKAQIDGQTENQTVGDMLQVWNDQATRGITGQVVPIEKGGAFPKVDPNVEIKTAKSDSGPGQFIHVSRPEPVAEIETPEGTGVQNSMLGNLEKTGQNYSNFKSIQIIGGYVWGIDQNGQPRRLFPVEKEQTQYGNKTYKNQKYEEYIAKMQALGLTPDGKPLGNNQSMLSRISNGR